MLHSLPKKELRRTLNNNEKQKTGHLEIKKNYQYVQNCITVFGYDDADKSNEEYKIMSGSVRYKLIRTELQEMYRRKIGRETDNVRKQATMKN